MTSVESVITEFLSTPPSREGVVDPDSNLVYFHKGEKYQYMILVNLADKLVQISGGHDVPFGARSLFESYANYESAAIEHENGYGDKKQLVFRDLKENMLIMVMMWDNKDLSVWRYRTAQKSVLTETALDTEQFQSKSQPDVHATDHRIAA